MARDDFNQGVKETLARRVGVKCSNPNCRKPTSGPQEDPTKSTNVGVAAHITAAAEGGPRYDSTITSKERKSIENAIWLCQVCAKLIDNDDKRFTADLLRQWKRHSEEAARMAIEAPLSEPLSRISDVDVIKFYAQALDRPAFQDHFRQEGSMEAFDKAIEDTITAINTGCLRARDGAVLQQSKGKAYLGNFMWRGKMDTIVDMLRAIRSRYSLAVKLGQIQVQPPQNEQSWYYVNDSSISNWMDESRSQVLALFSTICQEAGIHPPRANMMPRRGW